MAELNTLKFLKDFLSNEYEYASNALQEELENDGNHIEELVKQQYELECALRLADKYLFLTGERISVRN